MKFFLRRIFLFLFVLAGICSVFAAEPLGVCCYRSGDFDVYFSGVCQENEIELGLVISVPAGGTPQTFCDNQFGSKRLVCVSADGSCFELVEGRRIYDIPAVLNSFDNLDRYCLYYDDYKAGECLTGSASVVVGEEGEIPSADGVGVVDGVGLPEFPGLPVTGEPIGVRVFCENAGGPLGIFVTRSACEAIDGCLYNPYLGGHLTEFESGYSESFNFFDDFENACIPKVSIKSCFDYKTEENCEGNLGQLFEESCRWVPAGDFAEQLFSDAEGVCISTLISEDKYFNKNFYYKRGNLIGNPSFELTGDDYVWSGEGSRVGLVDSFHGNYSHKIGSGGEISQMIDNVGRNVAYGSFVYVRTDSLSAGQGVEVEIKSYDKNGAEISNGGMLESFFLSEVGVFERIDFSPFISPRNVDSVSFEIRSFGGSVFIDGVSFVEIGGDTGNLRSSDVIFVPVESVSEKASRCDLCFDKNNLNSCTPEKAGYLGDCSFVASDVGKSYGTSSKFYLGQKSNPYFSLPWENQALSNSKLFCELYLNEESCVDPESYVNLHFSYLHGLSGDTLCKWDERYGCFKDSDNDGVVDTKTRLPFFRGVTGGVLVDGSEVLYENLFSDFSYYDYGEGSDKLSDFALACDVLPPYSYFYFSGVNANGQRRVLNFVDSELVGDVFFYVEAADAILDGCEMFSSVDEAMRLYIDYEVNGESWFRWSAAQNQERRSISAKEYFVDGDENSLLVDGENKISIIVKDQSGNIGREWNYSVRMDVSGPVIELVRVNSETFSGSDRNWIQDVYTKNGRMDFVISDSSAVSSCSYRLQDFTQGGIPLDYYKPSGDFFVGLSGQRSVSYSLSLSDIIFNTTARSNSYLFDVTCLDMFGQSTTAKYLITADFDTSLVLNYSVLPYEEGLMRGFFGGESDFVAYSSENSDDLKECFFDFRGGDGFIGTGRGGFLIEDYEDEEGLYNSIIKGKINFNSDGRKEGSITCIDVYGNSVSRDLIYYFDTAKPRLLSYELEGWLDAAGVNSVVEAGGSFYTIKGSRGERAGDLILNVDGTGSPPLDGFDMMFVKSDGTQVPVSRSALEHSVESEGFSSVIRLDRKFEPDSLVYQGIPVEGEEGLFRKRYNLSFSDLAGNYRSEFVDYFYDGSVPDFVFSGDVVVGDAGLIYSKSVNPVFEVGFGTPSYRTFSCGVSAVKGGLEFGKSFGFGSGLRFTLWDINPSLQLDGDETVELTFDCVDFYGVSLSDTFVLSRDNRRPELNDFYFERGDIKYFKNFENYAYDDLVDRLVFDLNDTDEENYFCRYRLSNVSSLYSCYSGWFEKEFSESGIQATDEIVILSGSEANRDALCLRTDDFFEEQRISIARGEMLSTKLFVEGYCQDVVSLRSERRSFDLEINYVEREIMDFGFDYVDGVPFARVQTANEHDEVVISLDEGGGNVLQILSESSAGERGTYLFGSSSGLSIGDLEEGVYDVWGVVFDSAGDKLESRKGELVVDRSLPVISLDVRDDFDGVIYFDEFGVDFDVSDGDGKVGEVLFFLNGNLVYTSLSLGDYDNTSIFEPLLSENYYASDLSSYAGRVVVFGGEVGQLYTFTVRAVDWVGNVIERSRSVLVGEGVGFRLLDSDSALVDRTPGRRGWVTRNVAPVLMFEVSQGVDSCSIFPLIDSEWREIIGDELAAEISQEIVGVTEFSFDLSSFSGFDLSKLSERVSGVKVVCMVEGEERIFTQALRYVDYLPDYVLSSGEGFVLNNEPYQTQARIRSVGAYPYISCEYGLDDGEYVAFGEGFGVEHSAVLDFGDFDSGVHYVKVLCEDALGIVGPEKFYEFLIDKEGRVEIADVKLLFGDDEYVSEDGVFYIGSSTNVDLSFGLNRKDGVECDYLINPAGSFISGVVGFFRSLFGIGREEIPVGASPYEFRASGLVFEEGQNELQIRCSVDGIGSESVEFDVWYLEDEFDVGVVREER